MSVLRIGDIVTRASYGGDVFFNVTGIEQRLNEKVIYFLRGIFHRIHADSTLEDLVKQDSKAINAYLQRNVVGVRNYALRRGYYKRNFFMNRLKSRPGKILHIDASRDFLDICIKHYRDSKLQPVGVNASESEQPEIVRRLLERNRPDILVLTGHDSMKKDPQNIKSMDSYRNSKYFVQSVKEARAYEPSKDKLCIFAGACQSYYEAIMSAGANYASSPGRILINALDPAFVSEKIALTETKQTVTPAEISEITISGAKGIGGINTRGHLTWI